MFSSLILAAALAVDGIYPHLCMFNGEGECGTGAVVPWAGSLWVVTYGPHCATGSTDKLYQITPELKQVIRTESIGGTPANRLIHRETNQLLIGPYVIDAKGDVRTVPVARMPGRLTGAARHLTDMNKVYVATMETGLYELDMRTLAVNTLIRENGKNDWQYAEIMKRTGAWPGGWDAAPQTKVPGYHAKGLSTGFGRVFVANNGEDSEAARQNPFVPSGVLAWWNEPGKDWSTIRRCQFTEVTTRDGICGNEHPDTNPVWSLGWDAKSVLLAVTTNGVEWSYYRLPKASHCYDGAHGWNTEWPRIRDVGFDDGTLLATMHGTFWKFPADFSPASPDGIRPLSTYLKVIGDFCRWKDRIVFGCDDQAQNEFLGTRTLKKGAPKRERSQSNLWFVKPEALTTFGPPSGEGWVWLDEDVKVGALSDPFLYAGYAEMRFAFKDSAGRDIRHELLREGDWVRVRALEDAKGANAHFRYGPKRPSVLPKYDGFVEVYDDHSKKTYRFPNVNGDKTVICREVATERDLLYVGGVFYELPADNAGGFAALRPIALADEPVKSIEAKLGLVYVNGKSMALDSLWRNGTAAEAYWLWEECRALKEERCDRSFAGSVPEPQPWNGNAIKFTFPPTFTARHVPGVTNYLVRVTDSKGWSGNIRMCNPQISLNMIWDRIADGWVMVWIEGHRENWSTTHAQWRDFRCFVKTPDFKEGAYTPAARSYADCIRLGFGYLLKKPNIVYLLENGRPDPDYSLNRYPTKMHAATILGMVSYMGLAGADRERALKVANLAAEHLMSVELGADTPYRYFTPTYEDPKAVAEGRRELQLTYPAYEGRAYLALHGVTKDERLIFRAKAIVDLYVKLQESDGTWPMKVVERTGRPISPHSLTLRIHSA